MPTETFFRLPEEKRTRFLDAAWAEFTRVSLAEVSVNRIVQAAGIPRGSFYQYFADKEELFVYFMETLRVHFSGRLLEFLKRSNGDLFQAQLMAFERFAVRREQGDDPMVNRCMQMLRLNPMIDMQKIATNCQRDCLLEGVLEQVNARLLRSREPEYIRRVYTMSLMVLASAIMEQALHPERLESLRAELVEMLEILKHGSLRPVDAGEGEGV